jgi:hypothetical protein
MRLPCIRVTFISRDRLYDARPAARRARPSRALRRAVTRHREAAAVPAETVPALGATARPARNAAGGPGFPQLARTRHRWHHAASNHAITALASAARVEHRFAGRRCRRYGLALTDLCCGICPWLPMVSRRPSSGLSHAPGASARSGGGPFHGGLRVSILGAWFSRYPYIWRYRAPMKTARSRQTTGPCLILPACRSPGSIESTALFLRSKAASKAVFEMARRLESFGSVNRAQIEMICRQAFKLRCDVDPCAGVGLSGYHDCKRKLLDQLRHRSLLPVSNDPLPPNDADLDSQASRASRPVATKPVPLLPWLPFSLTKDGPKSAAVLRATRDLVSYRVSWRQSLRTPARRELVPRHSDFDRLNPGQSSSGRCFGSKSTSMLRATLGCLLIKPARSSVTTIW